jgi:penicillin amidase
MERVLTRRQIWCDDVRTEPIETCAELAAMALDAALLDLRRRFGDPDSWRWGDAHVAGMTHPVFTGQPLLGRLFDIDVPSGGDSVTVDVGHFNPGNPRWPFASTHAPTYRAIYDLADLDASRFVSATGQSGNPLSRHYRDLTRLWAAGTSVPIGRDRASYRKEAIGTLRLQSSDRQD